jgi:hypothetical protein
MADVTAADIKELADKVADIAMAGEFQGENILDDSYVNERLSWALSGLTQVFDHLASKESTDG